MILKTYLLIDSWENQEAIDANHNSKMMKTIIELINKYDLHMKVERYLSLGDNNKLMALITKQDKSNRIGVAKGKFVVPDEFDLWDKDIEKMFNL